MAAFKLTVREGPRVERSNHDSLDAALAALSAQVEQLRGGEQLEPVRVLREYGPEKQVKARLEISAGSAFRRREAGVDVMGDGAVVPYKGGTFKRHLDPPEGTGYTNALREALGE